MNLSQFEDKTRYYLDDDSNARFSTDELYAYINIALNHYHTDLINKQYARFLLTENLTVTNGLASLPTDFYSTHIVYFVDGTNYIPLEYYVNYENVETTNIQSVPYKYSYEGNYIKTDCPINGTIKLVYYPVFEELTLATDEPIAAFITSWHNLVPLRAALIAKAGREEDDTTGLAGILQSMEIPYNEYLTKMTDARSFIQPFYI